MAAQLVAVPQQAARLAAKLAAQLAAGCNQGIRRFLLNSLTQNEVLRLEREAPDLPVEIGQRATQLFFLVQPLAAQRAAPLVAKRAATQAAQPAAQHLTVLCLRSCVCLFVRV